ESLNVLDEAEKFFKSALNERSKLSGEGLKEAQVFQKLPTSDTLNLRLSEVCLEKGEIKKAAEYLGAIVNADQFSENEKIERSLILAAIAEKEERIDIAQSALKDLADHWKGNPALLAEHWLKLAKLNRSQKN